MATTPEGALSRQIEAWLKKKAAEGAPLYWEHRSGAGGFAYKKGLPDFFIVANGRHVEAELKAPGGRLTPMQEKWAAKLKAAGCIYCVPRCVADLEGALAPLLP